MRLKSGLDLYRPNETLTSFIRQEYEAYDGIKVAQDNVLRPEEIAISVMVNSQISGNTARQIWENRKPVEDSLRRIGSSASIADVVDKIPWDEVGHCVDGICRVPRAKLAVASKILHKKRPALIPMMDSVIIGYYSPLIQKQAGSLGQYAAHIMRVFRCDLLSVHDELEAMSTFATALGKPITVCRALEVLIWATLEPREYYRKHERVS